jgi:DNA-binding NarL/FixJ family response regulator
MGSARQSAEPRITVLLVDDDAMLRHGLAEMLEAFRIVIAGEASNAQEAIERSAELTPDLVLMPTAMRGASAIEATRRICEMTPGCRVLILSNSSDSANIDAALRAGACGYLLKDDSPGEIAAGIRAANAGGWPLSPRVTAALLGPMLHGGGNGGGALSARERSVLELLADGRRNSEISEDLSISVSTVKRHVSNVFAKLGVENRTQAAVVATRRGLL